MSLTFGGVSASPQHHHPQLSPRMTGGGIGGASQDWLKAWKAWAATRKRGKMAQFIVQKLEDNKQARWLNITAGKFELTEWHNIAEEWFKEKPRSSDQVDAPCMLRKGLPRAFPGLDEVKTESVKEGTQYRSRVFQAPQALVQEVQLYVNKPAMASGSGYPANGSITPYYQLGQKEAQGDFIASGSNFVSINQTQRILGSQPSTHYPGTPPLYGSPHSSSFQHMSPSALKVSPSAGNKIINQGYSSSYGEMSPGGNVDGGIVKVEECSPYSAHNNSPYSSHSIMDANSPPMSESTYSNYSDGAGLYNGQQNASPVCIKSEAQGIDNYDQMTDSSPYSVNGGGGLSPATGFSHNTLEIPTSADGVLGGIEWGGVGEMGVGGLTPVSSPHYSPEPNNYNQIPNSNPLDIDLTSGSMASPGIIPPQLPPIQHPQAFLDVKPYPDKSPLEGGGHLALIFGGELPHGPKWLSFISQQRPEYVHQVQAYEENLMALSTIIPKHDIPETMTLQVIVHGQVVAQTNFTYYANAQYNSDMLFHYLVQNFPGYFPEAGMEGGLGGVGGIVGGGDVFSGSGYCNNIPSTSFNLLLGSCRLGIEELVFATLQLPSMKTINTEQLLKAQRLCEEHSHSKLAEVMQGLVEFSEISSRGERGDNQDTDHLTSITTSEEGQKIMSRLNSSESPEVGGMSIISRLVQIHKMDKRSKLEEEREQQVPSSPTILPASPVPEGMGNSCTSAQFPGGESNTTDLEESITKQRRKSSSNRLQRQEKSVCEDDDLPTPVNQHSRQSIAEKDDHLPPLRPVPPSTRRMPKRTLISTHSDAADSAVSMSFDREHGDYEQEVARRTSASIALLGLYSLNMSSMDGSAVTIKIEPEAGYTFANSLQYECVYQVTDDYPSQSDATNVIFKAGDKIVQIGDALVRDKGPDDFAELLQDAVNGTTVRIVPRVSPPPVSGSINSSIGYGSLDTVSTRSVGLKQTDQQVIDSITMKVSNLLSMKGSGFKRTLTLPFSVTEKGFGFKMIGGNVVGLFVSEAKRKELQIGDQILEIAGHNALQMSHYEATELVTQAKETLQLKVSQNVAKFKSIRDQFEHESFYVRCHMDHVPTDSRDMSLSKGALVRVVNSSLFPDFWLAWSVDESTGIDMELRRIPSPAKAYHQYGKHVYQSVEAPNQDVMVS